MIKVQLGEKISTSKKFEFDMDLKLKKVREIKSEPMYTIILSEVIDEVLEQYRPFMIIPIDHVDGFIREITHISDHKTFDGVTSITNVTFFTDMIEIIDAHYPSSHEMYRRVIKIDSFEIDRVVGMINRYIEAIEKGSGECNV